MAVAPQEALQPQHVAAAGASDDDRPARAGLEQPHAAQDQRAHDGLAEFGRADQQGPQVRRVERQGRAALRPGAGGGQGAAAGELADLARELANRLDDDLLLVAKAIAPQHLDGARQQ